MKGIAKRTIRGCLLLGLATAVAQAASAAPQQDARAGHDTGVPSYQRDLAEKYSPLYRSRPFDRSSRLEALRRDALRDVYRYRPNYRRALPLNRSGVYRSWPPNYYRRVTPYYDGRGYGVPSTSPYRFHRDLDTRIRSWRRH